jgi:hypothetical protein
MDKKLTKLIDAAMESLEQFRSERKRIVAAVLAEGSDDLMLDDQFYNAWFDSETRELERREIFSRAQAYWTERKLIDLLSRPESEEDSWLLQSETDGAETKAGSVTGQFQ